MKIYHYIIACALILVACSDEEHDTRNVEPLAVSFATEVGTPSTRVTTGAINSLKDLKENVSEGFGVFAYLTDDNTFVETFPTSPSSENPSKAPTTYSSFSDFFMQNQQVIWGVQYIDAESTVHKDWVYSPLKYWPNSTNNSTSRYISFFAYAPFIAEAGATYGVTNFTRAEDRSPHIIYKIGAADEQVDLLWANKTDATRNGQGLITADSEPLTYQKVPLQFHHALAAVDIYVQRVYDEPAYTGKAPETEQNTKLYVSKLVLTSKAPATGKNALQKSGKLSLIDGTWEDDGTWVGGLDAGASDVKLEYGERMFVDSIRGTILTSEEEIRDAELDKWETATSGVTGKELYLLKDSMTQMFIPRKVTLIPTLSYAMVTRDDDLEINYLTDKEGHRYARIPHEVEGNSVTLDLKAGKRYSLLLRISAEHISFEVLTIVDWDFPMRYTPTVVTPFEPDSIGHRLDE